MNKGPTHRLLRRVALAAAGTEAEVRADPAAALERAMAAGRAVLEAERRRIGNFLATDGVSGD